MLGLLALGHRPPSEDADDARDLRDGPVSRALAVHGEDVTLQAVVLGRGIVALITKEAVPGAAMLRLPMPFHTSLPFGRELTLATFEKQTWKRLCYVLSMNYN